MRLIFKTSSVTPDFFYVFNLILSFSTCSQSFKKICVWELLGANVLKYILTKNLFWSLKELELTKFTCSHKQEIAFFACTLKTILHNKKHTDNQNQNILQKIILKFMPFWPESGSDECHFLSLKFLMLRCAQLMNSIAP